MATEGEDKEEVAANGEEKNDECDMKLLLKVSGGQQFELKVSREDTVKRVKERAEKECSIPVAQQRLIYRGRILKDDSSIQSHDVADGHTMHLVKSSAAAGGAATAESTSGATATTTPDATAPTPASGIPPPAAAPTGVPAPAGAAGMDPFMQMMMGMGGGGMSGAMGGAGVPGAMVGGGMPGVMGAGGMPGAMGGGGMTGAMGGGGGAPMGGMGGGMAGMAGMDPQFLQQMMSSPMVQNMMQEVMSNPDMLRSMTQNNPMLQQMVGNPMLQQMLSDPQTIQAALQMNQAYAQGQQQQATLQGTAGTTTTTTTGNTTTTTTDGSGNTTTTRATIPPFHFMMGNAPAGAPPTTAGAQVAPGGAPAAGTGNFAEMIMQQMQNNPQLMAQMMAMGGGGMGAPPVSNMNPADRFSSQLTQLQEMGFIDRESNIQALQETNGDVNAAIGRLLERGLGN
eukprot:GHVS01079087.1.p1 GENE.GHVS01079087.1~~GHVS01079087.1.p1  ORF type:complete len:453 (-),score=112.96 GHVS01079087.1:278-1636(-)